MKKLTMFFSVLALAVLLLSGSGQAALYYYTATLDGAQEVPPVVTTASGFAYGTVDDVALILTWDLTFKDMLSPATASHFHGPAQPGVNAGVQVPIPGITGLSGNVSNSAAITPEQAVMLIDGLMYINIHTTIVPGGEIRGQVIVPVTGSLLLLSSGLGLLAWRRFR